MIAMEKMKLLICDAPSVNRKQMTIYSAAAAAAIAIAIARRLNVNATLEHGLTLTLTSKRWLHAAYEICKAIQFECDPDFKFQELKPSVTWLSMRNDHYRHHEQQFRCCIVRLLQQ